MKTESSTDNERKEQVKVFNPHPCSGSEGGRDGEKLPDDERRSRVENKNMRIVRKKPSLAPVADGCSCAI